MLTISEKGCVVLCCLKCVLTMFAEGPEDAKNERSTAVMSAAIVERQKYIKTKNYIHTVKIYQKKMQCGRVWGINLNFGLILSTIRMSRRFGVLVTNFTLFLKLFASAELVL